MPVAGDDLADDEVVHWNDETTVEIATGFDINGKNTYQMLMNFYQSEETKSLGNVDFNYDQENGVLKAHVKFNGDKELFEIPASGAIAYANLRFKYNQDAVHLNSVDDYLLLKLHKNFQLIISHIYRNHKTNQFKEEINDIIYPLKFRHQIHRFQRRPKKIPCKGV